MAMRALLVLLSLLAVARPAAASGTIVTESPTNTLVYAQPLIVSGYAIDTAVPTGTGIDLVQIYACPGACTGSNAILLGTATYGGVRPDVATLYGHSRFTNAGFTLTVSGLAPGPYQIEARGRTTGTSTWAAHAVFATLTGPVGLVIDAPSPNAAVTQPFTVSGWAADFGATTGTGISQVSAHVYPNPGSGAPPIWLPAVTTGTSRPDIAGYAGLARYDPSGWSVTVPAGYLAPGEYLLILFAHGTTTTVGASRVLYVNAAPAALVVDRAGGGTGGVSSSPAGLSCPGGAGTQALPCGSTYLQVNGTAVTLTATADAGSTFTGWSGACTGTGACAVTMSQGRYVIATFSGTATPTYQTTYYHHDTVGSVRAITDAAAQPIATHAYAPFGEDPSPTTGDPNRFTGQELDPETALQYFGARYYRSTIGRFMSVDPGQVGAHLPSPQTWNAYAYARNSPFAYLDPDGRCDRLTIQVGDQSVTTTCIVNVSSKSPTVPEREDSESIYSLFWWMNSGRRETRPVTLATPEIRTRRTIKTFNDLIGDIGDRAGVGVDAVLTLGAVTALPVVATAIPAGAMTQAVPQIYKPTLLRTAYHHTMSAAKDAIMGSYLKAGSYATPTAMGAADAMRRLALDPRSGVRDAVVQIDLMALRAAGLEVPFVSPIAAQFGMPGGGLEMIFGYNVLARFLR